MIDNSKKDFIKLKENHYETIKEHKKAFLILNPSVLKYILLYCTNELDNDNLRKFILQSTKEFKYNIFIKCKLYDKKSEINNACSNKKYLKSQEFEFFTIILKICQ